ncbi:transposase, partial [Sporosarcina limicola]|nr:hypothetical protein [Sporosarcina limicola]
MDSTLFQQLFIDLVAQIHQKTNYTKITMPLKIIDSSTLPLNLTNHQWAKFRKTKAGVKLHLRLVFMEKGTSYPEKAVLTTAKEHDRNQLEVMVDDKERMYVFDRGYLDYERFDRMTVFSMSPILPDSIQHDQLKSRVSLFFKQAKIGTFLHQSNIRKEKGLSALILIQFIFSLVLQGKNLYRTLESGRFPDAPEKDAVYDLLKRTTYNWRKLLSLVSAHLIETILKPLTSEDRDRVLILDDSTYNRNRSKSVELLTRVFDHTTGKYIKGFRMLTLGWSDGAT